MDVDLQNCKRIAIIGPSSSGKSTLARSLGAHLNIPHYHLDAVMMLPGWQPRPFEDFKKRHDAIIEQDAWVIEGAYSKTIPQRFARADVVLFLDMNGVMCGLRFLKRTWQNRGKQRPESAEGCVDTFSWDAIYHVTIKYTMLDYTLRRRPKYKQLLEKHAKGKYITLQGFKALNRFYSDYEISRRS